MKGIIFTVFNKMIEEKFGMGMWEELLEGTCPHSRGVYTASGTYQDTELFGFVGLLSKKTGTPADKLVEFFGEYTLLELAKAYPSFFECKTLKEFLLSIHDVVHIEVKKLYPDAGLPTFRYEDPAPNRLVMLYESPRKLCSLAEGLINGAAKQYKTDIIKMQSKCLHRGDDHCRFEIEFK